MGAVLTRNELAQIQMLLSRLIRKSSVKWMHQLIYTIGCCTASALMLIFIAQIVPLLVTKAFIPVLLTSYVAIVLFPPLIALTTAQIASAEIYSPEFDLLRLTQISSLVLLWSYTLAALYRLRTLIKVIIILMPLSITCMTLALIRGATYRYGCIASIFEFMYCDNSVYKYMDREFINQQPLPLPLPAIISSYALGLAILGIYILVAALAASIALRKWARTSKSVTAMIVSFCIGLLLAGLVSEIMFYAVLGSNSSVLAMYNAALIVAIGILIFVISIVSSNLKHL
jgi:hypothetical protein